MAQPTPPPKPLVYPSASFEAASLDHTAPLITDAGSLLGSTYSAQASSWTVAAPGG